MLAGARRRREVVRRRDAPVRRRFISSGNGSQRRRRPQTGLDVTDRDRARRTRRGRRRSLVDVSPCTSTTSGFATAASTGSIPSSTRVVMLRDRLVVPHHVEIVVRHGSRRASSRSSSICRCCAVTQTIGSIAGPVGRERANDRRHLNRVGPRPEDRHDASAGSARLAVICGRLACTWSTAKWRTCVPAADGDRVRGEHRGRNSPRRSAARPVSR